MQNSLNKERNVVEFTSPSKVTTDVIKGSGVSPITKITEPAKTAQIKPLKMMPALWMKSVIAMRAGTIQKLTSDTSSVVRKAQQQRFYQYIIRNFLLILRRKHVRRYLRTGLTIFTTSIMKS